MVVTDLKLNKQLFSKSMVTEEDRSVTCTRYLVGYIPQRFVESSLASASDVITTIGVIGFVDPNKKEYTYMFIPSNFTLMPNNIGEETINGVKYLTMEFEPGDVVFKSISSIQDPQISYYFYREFSWLAKIPWYVDHKTIRKMFDRSKSLTGRKVGSDPKVFRVLTSLMERDPDNPNQAYRYSRAIHENRPPLVVGLNNGSLLINGTFNLAIGGYDQENLINSILKEDTRVTTEELIIKGGFDD